MPAKIGTREGALAALKAATSNHSPAGMKPKHGGCRKIFIDKTNGVVYKVDYGWAASGSYSNETELKNARQLARRFPDGKVAERVRIPKTSGYRIKYNGATHLVVAMEYIEGKSGVSVMNHNPRIWKDTLPERQTLRKLNFRDMHGMNFQIDKARTVWPIDLGSPRTWRDGESPDNRMFDCDERDDSW